MFISVQDSLRKGDLSTEQREDLKPKQFALPKKAEDKEERAESGNYPIPDLSHARNALAMVAMHGTSEEKAKVRAAVYKKYPGLKKRKKEEEQEKSLFVSAENSLNKSNGKIQTVKKWKQEEADPYPTQDQWDRTQKVIDPKGYKSRMRTQAKATAKRSQQVKKLPSLRSGEYDATPKTEGIAGKVGKEATKAATTTVTRPAPKVVKSLDPVLAARMKMPAISTMGPMGRPVVGQTGFFNSTIAANFSKGSLIDFEEKKFPIIEPPKR